ncbi:MAG: hypothetical protein QME74_09585 [Candidatus Edwardsbacteria bacterium]|nr:hypothetical protein [Candidatus Edwardsbacteria bacterium]
MQSTNPVPAVAPAPATKPPLTGVIDLIKQSWAMYQTRLWAMAGIGFIFYVISLLIMFALAATALANVGFFLFNASQDYKVTDWFDGFSAVTGLLFVVLMLVSLLISAYQQSALIRLASEDDKNIVSVLKKALGRVPALFWATFIAGLLIILGLILFLIPGVILAVMFAFVGYVVVLEGVSGSQALSRSRALVRGRWWPVFWRGLGFFLLIIIPAGIAGSIVSSIIGDGNNTVSNLLTALFVTPFGLVYGYNLYRNLKATSGAA